MRKMRVAMRTSMYTLSIRPSRPIRLRVCRRRAHSRITRACAPRFIRRRAKPDTLYIGLNDRDPKWHDLYELSISSGEKKLMRKNTEQISGWDFDHDGNLKLAERTNQAGDTEIMRVDGEGFKQIYSCTVLESCGVVDFDAANKQVYLITNKGDVDLTEIEMLDPSTGSTKKYESDPENRVDIQGLEISDVDYHVYFSRYEDDRSRLYFKDKDFEKEYHWLESKLPGKEINFGARSKDENIWIVSAASDTEPGETYVWNRKAGLWICSIGYAKRCRANRYRIGSPTSSSHRTGWKFMHT